MEGNKLNITDEDELVRLVHFLRDFSALLQVIGRLSSFFVGDFFLARIQEGQDLLKQLISVASFSSKVKFYSLQIPTYVAKAFVEV